MLQSNEVTTSDASKQKGFQKGHKGYFRGKRGAREKLAERWETMANDAMLRLHQLVHSENEPVALAACKEVLDRHMGKARTQAVVNVQHTDITALHLAALQTLAAKPVQAAIKDVTNQARIEAPKVSELIEAG